MHHHSTKCQKVVQIHKLLFLTYAKSEKGVHGGSPLTLRPNFNSEKGSVTAAAAACLPRRGSFVGENLWEYIARVLNLSCNLRVILDFVVQVERELFSFFASFFLFSKEKKKRNSL